MEDLRRGEGTVGDEERLNSGEKTQFANTEGLLKSPTHVAQGNWWDAAFHMGTAVPTPAAVFPLSYALSRMGWAAGLIALVAGGAVTFYTSCLLASLSNYGGKRHARYRDLAFEIWGKYGMYAVLILQVGVNVGSLITIAVPSGLGLQFIYQLSYPGEGPTLQVWIIYFMALQVVLAMAPDLHSLRIVNAISTLCVVIMSVIGFSLAIYDGSQIDRSTVSYAVSGASVDKVFAVFNAMATISLSYGNTMLPEIQATLKEPVVRNMYKTIAGAYCIILPAFFGVGIAGYWAYGFNVQSYLLFSISTPSWCVVVANIAAIIQFAASFQFYCQLTFEYFETKYGDVSRPKYGLRNIVPRFLIRTSFLAIITLVSCALPFFGDFVALVGALGYTPMDFVLPIFLFMTVHKLSGWKYWGNITIAVFYIAVGVCGAVGAIRSIILDATTYRLFANL